MGDEGIRPSLRMAELVAALSLGIDLGFGQPMEHVLRQCLVALRLAERAGLDEDRRASVYYTALLLTVACHSDAHEQAKWFGDDIALKAGKYEHGLKSVRGAVSTLRMIGSGHRPLHRFRIGLEFAVSGRHDVDQMIDLHSRLGQRLAEELGLPDEVYTALAGAYEWWNGKGWPGALKGDAIPIEARIAQLAEFLEVAHRTGGPDEAITVARRRRGTQFDPDLVDLVIADPRSIFEGVDLVGNFETVIKSEPALALTLSPGEFDRALLAIANFVDLKSPYTLGHSAAVADLARSSAAGMGLTADEQRTVYRAGLVHGFGRLGVSNAIWDKRGALGPGEWERVRMWPYLTDRMLRQSPALAPLGQIAVEHRERLDGSGYPRGLRGNAISREARLLGAAAAYQAMLEPRPHRPAMAPDDAATALRADVRAGALDGLAVDAVLTAAGHRVGRRREGPAGLTSREIEVLVLLARGLSTKQIADQLTISAKTAGNHIEHIYTKIDASNRSTASLFAVQHGLLP